MITDDFCSIIMTIMKTYKRDDRIWYKVSMEVGELIDKGNGSFKVIPKRHEFKRQTLIIHSDESTVITNLKNYRPVRNIREYTKISHDELDGMYVMRTTRFLNGILHGQWYNQFSNGLVTYGEYYHGKKVGVWKHTSVVVIHSL